MKKTIAILLALWLCVSLCACGNESEDRFKDAQNLFRELADIKFVYDDLYLTEHAEIHHNAWTTAYEKAIAAYNALPAEDKAKLDNDPYYGRYGNLSVSHEYSYEHIFIEQEIALYCKDAAVEAVKDSLVNKSSYEEYDWMLERIYYLGSGHGFEVEIKIEYSATNKMGGRIDDTAHVYCKGTYENGKITITHLS